MQVMRELFAPSSVVSVTIIPGPLFPARSTTRFSGALLWLRQVGGFSGARHGKAQAAPPGSPARLKGASIAPVWSRGFSPDSEVELPPTTLGAQRKNGRGGQPGINSAGCGTYQTRSLCSLHCNSRHSSRAAKILECGDWSPLFLRATCRPRRRDQSRRPKARTSPRTPE